MSESLDRFVSLLLRSELITESQLEAVRKQLSSENPAAVERQWAEQLADSGHLTEFQATEVRKGKVDNLVIDDYLILHPVGRGGMGEVFKARHAVMKREVAVKFTLPDAGGFVTPASAERFQREVEAASQLMHPNIVSSLDAGRRGEVCYLVMEYVRGTNLANHVHEHGPMSFRQALECTLQVAQGLGFAHAKGFVHRDVKPSNLLLTSDGQVKILDMGLIRRTVYENQNGQPVDQSDESLTTSGQLLGSVDFMAPEQAIDPRTADARSDIYSLGCTVYFLLTGTPPYRRGGKSAMSRVIAHREKPIPLICKVRADVPKEFEPVFQKMLAKQASRRYQNCQELIHELRQLQADLPVGPASLAVTESLIPRVQAASWRVLASVVSALILMVAVVFATYKFGLGGSGTSDSGAGQLFANNADVPNSEAVDLLAVADLDRHVRAGSGWELSDGKLQIPNSIPSKLHIPVMLPDAFHLKLSVKRNGEQGPFAIGISGPRRKCHLLIDAWREGGEVRMTALGSTQGRLTEITENKLFLHPQQVVDLLLNVDTDSLSLAADNQTVLQWQGDFESLSFPAGWDVGRESGVFVGSNDGATFEVTRLELVPGLAEPRPTEDVIRK